MADLDLNIHAATRLKVMSMLTAVSEVEFASLRDGLEVSDAVLSQHLAVLSVVGYVRSRKGVHRGRRTTWVSLTPQGH